MSDLIQRLRDPYAEIHDEQQRILYADAAAEIERLEGALFRANQATGAQFERAESAERQRDEAIAALRRLSKATLAAVRMFNSADEKRSEGVKASDWKAAKQEMHEARLEANRLLNQPAKDEQMKDHSDSGVANAQEATGQASGAAAARADTACHGLDTPERVCFYEQDFYVLSNFSAFRLRYCGVDFDTSEHAYQWSKFAGYRADIAHLVRTAPSAHEALKCAEEWRDQRMPGWDDVKLGTMRGILRAKVAQHEYVRRKLLATGDRELVENSWRDAFWGWGPNRDGQNMLGKLWMELRAELRAAASIETTAPLAPEEAPPDGPDGCLLKSKGGDVSDDHFIPPDNDLYCDRCGGEGWIMAYEGDGSDWGEDTYSGPMDEEIMCRACGGTGLLK